MTNVSFVQRHIHPTGICLSANCFMVPSDEKTSFMMKKVVVFSLGLIFRAIGGIPVDRSRNTSLVDQMANRFAGSKLFHLAITPEGTRKSNPNWKKVLLHCVESTSSYHAYRYRLSYQDYNFHQDNNANGRL